MIKFSCTGSTVRDSTAMIHGVAVARNGKDVVTQPGAVTWAVFSNLEKAMIQTAFWYLWMKQEFVYVGDEGVVEPGGKTQRTGWDLFTI